MKTRSLNLFIINNSPSKVADLHNYIENTFQSTFNIFSFNTGKGALDELERNTNLVILDQYLLGENGDDIRRIIRKSFPYTRVIMFDTNNIMTKEIDRFIETTKSNFAPRISYLKKITYPIRQIVNYPVKIFVREFNLKKIVAVYIVTFILVGITATTLIFLLK